MPFVKRNTKGEIEAVSQEKTEEFTEELDRNDSALMAFMQQTIAQPNNMMTESDLDFVRVVEDLVELLIAKNYIRFTDLPDKAQEKMRERQALRGKMATHLDLLGDDNDNIF